MPTLRRHLENPHKILIIRLSSIGDIILATALIRCVKRKYPAAEIDFLVKKQFLDIVKYNPNISNVIVFEKGEDLLELKDKIRRTGYDWIIDIHQNLRSFYLKIGLMLPKKTGYSKRLFRRSLLVNFGLNIYGDMKPVLLRYFEAVEKQGVTYDGGGTEVFVPAVKVARMELLLRESGYTNEKRLFVICPGASFTNKRWKAEGFAKVADHLTQNHKGWVAFIGGANDKELCMEVQNLTKSKTHNFAGQFSLIESAAILSLCHGFVGNDSGMLHLAQAFGKPVVGIYGPTVKELGYFPIDKKSVVIEKDIACRPCTHNGLDHCPKKHFRCMETISSEDVIEGLDSLMD